MESNRIAVLITGEVRTWQKASKYLFDYIESLYSCEIHYYFVTWTLTNQFKQVGDDFEKKVCYVNENDIRQTFENKTLVAVKTIEERNIPQRLNEPRGFYYKAFLTKIANVLKKRYELNNNFIYDQVIEIRPDLFKPKREVKNIPTCRDFEFMLGVEFIENNCPLYQDFYFRTNSYGDDVVSNRYYHKNVQKNYFTPELQTQNLGSLFFNTHWILYDYLKDRRMLFVEDTQVEAHDFLLLRPNLPDDLENYTFHKLNEYVLQWNNAVAQGFIFDKM